jgi:uncharacterized coiled-coil protein SlyX
MTSASEQLSTEQESSVPKSLTIQKTSVVITLLLLSVLTMRFGVAQGTSSAETIEQKVDRLTTALAHTQSQVEAYQNQLQDLKKQLSELQQQLAAEKPATTVAPATSPLNSSTASQSASSSRDAIQDIEERQALQESQITTHEQTKVETESKYPLKITGLILFNGYVNTRQVDVSADPTYTLPGNGSTGLSLRQTVLGFDARGPHLFGATSHADVRADFFAGGAQSSYAAAGLLRLRTAHAALRWQNTEAFVEQDRSLISPNTPSSLLAVSLPLFAWSGNLWTWNPQVGISHQIAVTPSSRLKVQAGLIDTADAIPPAAPPSSSTISLAERSRWPGTEARIASGWGDPQLGPEFGISGYFSPHETASQNRFNAWAGAIDLRFPVTRHFAFTANAYRGAGLGGLGGGGFVDYVNLYAGTQEIAHALDDVGGWAQLKTKIGERLEFNGGYGIDNPFASQIHASMEIPEYATYYGLARNRSTVGNVIYSPSSYLLFSLEYRHLWTNFATGPTNTSDVIGVGAGYRF